jgi:hypothetical protein
LDACAFSPSKHPPSPHDSSRKHETGKDPRPTTLSRFRYPGDRKGPGRSVARSFRIGAFSLSSNVRGAIGGPWNGCISCPDCCRCLGNTVDSNAFCRNHNCAGRVLNSQAYRARLRSAQPQARRHVQTAVAPTDFTALSCKRSDYLVFSGDHFPGARAFSATTRIVAAGWY